MSDQDFFFDDDVVEEVVEDTKISRAEAKAARSTKAGVSADADDGEVSGPTITATICALAALIALLIGVIGGIFIGRSLVPTTPVSSTIQGGGGMGGMGGGMGGGSAPILTDEQMEMGMPAGHPDIGGDAEDGDALESEMPTNDNEQDPGTDGTLLP